MKIQHDFHIHTALSLCASETATVDNYLKIAKNIGLKKLGFSNHFWDDRIEGANDWYKQQNYQHLSLLKPELEKAAGSGIQLYFGCETEYDYIHHGVAITEETAEKFDYVLVPHLHSHMPWVSKDYRMSAQKHMELMIQTYEEIIDSNVSRYITAMAHPFTAYGYLGDRDILIDMISDDVFRRLFEKTASKSIAFEINVSSMRNKTADEIETCPQIRMYKIAKECGCKFIFGSDAHNNEDHNSYSNADLVAELLDLKEREIADIAI